ncbi:S1-C subfamily serine protease [Azospirillum fermentarium]|uniref:S1 family peptidase n=1 Tax=Azospirillum fermentarium TaxID=1233114 RepID=UPI002225F318|nr:serine protease [Azospirillum fermentarium]MCW2248568.1 S1-C subfamily serine protease [Azospirillum fermentarium]
MAVTLAGVAALSAHLWLRRPAEVRQAVPAPAADLPADVLQRARQLEELNRSLEEAVTRQSGQEVPCPPGTVRAADAGPAAAPPVSAPASSVPAIPTTPAIPTPAAASPPPPPAAGAGNGLSALNAAQLVQRLEAGTALVIAGDSIATGFFVTPDLLVTNRHAVEDSTDGRVVIASRSLGRALPGTVVGASANAPVGGTDFALVRLPAGKASGTLPVTTSFAKLSGVTAAGYPGLTVLNDAGFRRLVGGDMRAAPDLNITQGTVQAIQPLATGGVGIVHTASILQGNSGGPLVDACGRVIGVNTFIAVDQEQSGRISYAQTTEALLAFLKRHGETLQDDSRPCGAP